MEDTDKKEKKEEDVDEKLLELVGNILSEDDEEGKKTDYDIGKQDSVLNGTDASDIDLDREIAQLEKVTIDEERVEEKTIERPPVSDDVIEETPSRDAEATKQPELTREEIISFFKSIPRVGLVTATKIVDSGYDHYGSLSTMEQDNLNGIPEIGPELTGKIIERVKQRFPPITKKEEEPVLEELKTEETAPEPAEKEEKKEEMDKEEDVKEEEEKTTEGSGDEGRKEEQVEPEEKEKETETGEGGGIWCKIKGFFRGKGKDKGETEAPTPEKDEDGSILPELEVVGGEKTESGAETDSDTPQSETPAEEAKKTAEEDGPSTDKAEEHKEIDPEVAKEEEVSLEVEVRDVPEKAAGSPVEDFVQKLHVERNIAEKLYDAGYNDTRDLKDAIPEDLEFVDGIDGPLAVTICNRIKELNI